MLALAIADPYHGWLWLNASGQDVQVAVKEGAVGGMAALRGGREAACVTPKADKLEELWRLCSSVEQVIALGPGVDVNFGQLARGVAQILGPWLGQRLHCAAKLTVSHVADAMQTEVGA